MPRIIPQYQVDDQLKYLYRIRKGKKIYKPVYDKYNEKFFSNIIEKTSIKSSFTAFKDTAIYERFMLNAAQFSAAKSVATTKLIQAEIFDENAVVRTYPKFKEKAEQVAETVNENWLRVEYESSRRQCVQSERFRRMYEDRDLYPYWQWRGRMDARERDAHREMEGKVFQIGDPEGDKCFSPADWNCRCEGEPVDGEYLEENGLQPVGPDELQEILKNNVDEQFQRSPLAGSLPNSGSYFEAMKSANQGNAEMFGMPDPESKKKLDGLAAKGVHHLAEIVDEWKDKYHVNKDGDVVFQNTKTFSNIRFTPKSLHTIQKHSRGFENIPDAVSSPDEIWNSWSDDKKQLKSIRNYIIFGDVNYVVQTLDGEITDAFAVNARSINKYRKGVIL
jgi:SPP1 gp7 family putative phage head morphogenesis protein